MLQEEELTGKIIGAAIEVHRELGPGLLESAYEACLCDELSLRNIPFTRQVMLEAVTDLHKAQLLTYLRISGFKVGLILNFNTVTLKDGITRLVL
jgi:hypothetical protein